MVGGWIENGRRMEKWEEKKYLVFLHLCLVRGMEKWREDRK